MPKVKIRKIRISGFRGIRYQKEFDLTSRFENLLIYGANAKGKSSIGDAFEWFFKGDIKELGKEGCSREDYRHRLLDQDKDAIVGLDFSEPVNNSELHVNANRRQQYSNESEEFQQYLAASAGELLWLRHKDLKKFVDKTKGDKRTEIAQLIGMAEWETIRNEMIAVENRLADTVSHIHESIQERQQEVMDIMGATEFSYEACWQYGSELARKLGIDKAIESLEDLIDVDEQAKQTQRDPDRTAEITRYRSLERLANNIATIGFDSRELVAFAEAYNQFCCDQVKILWSKVDGLFASALSILDSGMWEDETCPLCVQEIPSTELTDHIKQHRERNKHNQNELRMVEEKRTQAKLQIRKLDGVFHGIREIDLLEEGIEGELSAISKDLEVASANANQILGKPLELSVVLDFDELRLAEKWMTVSELAKSFLEYSKEALASLEVSDEERARIEAFQSLDRLASHMEFLFEKELEATPLRQQHSSLAAFTTAFQELRRNTMGEILEEISNDVSRYFLTLHPDEGFDDIQLRFLPQDDGVEFHIYYRGEEITPPRRFLSESYLNGLGICLFLATTQRFNQVNAFVVLDDVVNSFDAEHRSSLAKLLIDEFGDQQLIVLTHDAIWFDVFRRLAKNGWQSRRIIRWSYEEGVEVEVPPEIALDECDLALEAGDAKEAASKVRIYIEARLRNILHKVGGRVRYREGSANDARSCGELLFELKRHLYEAGFFDLAQIRPFDELEASTFIINYGSHDRPPAPAGLTIGDVQFALDRIQELEAIFTCPDCKKKLWNIVDRNFTMQCECGRFHI